MMPTIIFYDARARQIQVIVYNVGGKLYQLSYDVYYD